MWFKQPSKLSVETWTSARYQGEMGSEKLDIKFQGIIKLFWYFEGFFSSSDVVGSTTACIRGNVTYLIIEKVSTILHPSNPSKWLLREERAPPQLHTRSYPAMYVIYIYFYACSRPFSSRSYICISYSRQATYVQ